ncbi:MAG TPA: hypothetical protein ENK85_04480 [Saprospiraceae bacterium]|nr:hypothetical protein [Saprospiraceae bacterium]
MKKSITFTVLLFFTSTFLIAQGSLDFGVEFQAYPTGIMPGVRLEKNFSERHALHLRVGANIFDHRDWGKHFKETGSGYGFTLGYKRYFQPGHKRWFLGLRNDLWFNQVNWTKDIALPPFTGTTQIMVVQPTAEGGYTFVKNHLFFTPSLGFGFEINTRTKGEPTGEGAIVLLGITAGYRFW